MKVKLVQSHTESFVDLPFPDDPSCGRLKLWAELPVCTRLLPMFTNPKQGKIAFCLPFFKGGEHRWRNRRYIAEIGYMKRVFWMAYEFLTFTDLLDTETGLFIVIEEEYLPLLEPYRQHCGFPEDAIQVLPKLSGSHFAKVECLEKLCHKTDFDYYMSIDLSTTFYTQIVLCAMLQEHWRRSPETILWGKDPWHRAEDPIDLDQGNQVRADFATGPGFEIPLERFYIEMPKFFGKDTYESLMKMVMYPQINCAGWVYGVPRTHIESKEF